jgi:sugar phosphate isomerase/epimerase
LSLDSALALAAKHNVPQIEVRALGGTVDVPQNLAEQFGTPDKLVRHLRESPVRIVGFNASLHLVGSTAVEREQLVALAPWAEALGVRWLRVFDGGKAANAAEFAEASETLRWWRALRAQRGWQVDCMVETHDSLFTADAITRFVRATPDTAILWDAHHTWRKGGEDPVTTWRAIRPHVVHVHVKDSIDVPSAKHPFTYVLPGDGEFPIQPLLSALTEDGYAGAVSLEWERLWHPYLRPLEQALDTARTRNWW